MLKVVQNYLMKKLDIGKQRHQAKAITWRIIASLTTFLIGWSLTGDMHAGLAIGSVDFIIKFILYYAHERAWLRVNFGINHERDTPTSTHSS